jgi:signal peptidase II
LEGTLIYLTVFLPLLFTGWIDRLTKDAAIKFASGAPVFYGPFALVQQQNRGVVSGIYANVSPLLREVTLSTVAGFLLFIYFMIQYLIPSRSLIFRSGLSFLIGGILGNVSDRMLQGSVTDFLSMGNSSFLTPIFNLADVMQWVGYGLILFSLIQNPEVLFKTHEQRKSYWVNPKFQLSYCFNLMACGLGFSVISGAFTFTYLKIAFEQSAVTPMVASSILSCYFLVFALITVSFLIVLFILGMILSNRIAGPIFSFERFLEDLEKKGTGDFKLRSSDHFQHLEVLAKKLQGRKNQ